MAGQQPQRESVWIGTAPEQPSFAPLDHDTQAEVAVIGGGIVGITTALLLAEQGADVVLLESGQLARVAERGSRPLEDLTPGEGGIVSHAGEKVAGYRRDDGTLVAISTRCTHLGCQVKWNTAERSWDCPCHGSRFSPQGEVLQGPAVQPLELKVEELESG